MPSRIRVAATHTLGVVMIIAPAYGVWTILPPPWREELLALITVVGALSVAIACLGIFGMLLSGAFDE